MIIIISSISEIGCVSMEPWKLLYMMFPGCLKPSHTLCAVLEARSDGPLKYSVTSGPSDCVLLNKPGLFPFIAEAVSLSIGVNLVSEAVKCFPVSPRPAASSGARCTLLIILSTSSIQTYSGNTRPLIARDPFFTYCCTSSAGLARMWLTFFMVGGEKKIRQTES